MSEVLCTIERKIEERGEYVSSLMCHMDVMLALNDYFNIV